MTLRIHRAERTDLLADGLAELLATPLEDPFAEEVVVVPARGVERWVTQRLSHRLGVGGRGGDGVCAGVRFLSPHSLVALLLGKQRDDPWDPDRLVWPLLDVIDDSLGEAWCSTLAAHLGHGVDGEEGVLRRSRRYSVARRLAGLFAGYAVQRPALVADWREGRDTDGAGHPVDEDLAWQPELWRRLVARVDAVPPDVRHAETLARLRAGGDGLDLPPRLSLFGHTRLPVTEVELLGALGELRDVHLWLPQVSGRLWDDLAELSAPGRCRGWRTTRSGSSGIRCSGRSGGMRGSCSGRWGWSRQARPAGRLDPAARPAGTARPALGTGWSRQARPAVGRPLLSWLQHDLRANAEPDTATREGRVLDAEDRSVQVHACHGATRQVDVLREVLVGLLEDDPTLEPRDILVMCPDIEAYAPLIQAGFGLADLPGAEGHPGHRLRLRLADRALSSTNPLLAVAAGLAELAGGRVTATEVLDLASSEPVRRRFGFTDDDLAQLAMWVDQAAIRWGLDAGHRGAYGLGLADNTWEAGLSRILLGVTMAGDEHRYVDSALPVDDVSSGDIDLVGRFTEYVDRLRRFVDAAQAASTIGQWVGALSSAVEQLTAVAARDAWQQAQFDRELAKISDSAGVPGELVVSRGSTSRGVVSTSSTNGADDTTPLLLADVRHLLAHRLGGRPTRANFRTGTLTVCTMVPMRSVPHRVVCLLGLDDGAFPRTGSVDGDDVLARNPMTGERDVRSEDRQLFLDAILAAKETLVITYTGANEHTGAERPPAVPLGELLDALDQTAVVSTSCDQRGVSTSSTGVREQVVVQHPLQPFDARNLVAGGLVGARPFSFDRAALAGAEATRRPRSPVTTLVTEPLPARRLQDVSLADLQAFFAHPVRAFLRSRLDVTAPLEAEETHDAMPITLDGLEKWTIGDRMLADLLGGTDPASTVQAERLRGGLPPGRLGAQTLQEIVDNLKGLVTQTAPLRQGTPRALDVDIDLGGGRRLTGTVTSVFGNRLVSVSYSSLAAKHRLRSWVDLLALSAGHPDENWTAHALGRGRAGHRPCVRRPPRPPRRAVAAGPGRHLRPRHAGAAAAAGEDRVRVRRGEPAAQPGQQERPALEGTPRVGDRPLLTDRHPRRGRRPRARPGVRRARADRLPAHRPAARRAVEQRAAPARAVRRAALAAAARRRGEGGPPVSDMVSTSSTGEGDAFDICGPLPTGTTLLEASAGTGKTWTIGALVTRYVAEGVATLDQMLVVTFGRAASQELRERVRAQLVEAERALAAPERDREPSDLVDLLLDAPPAELELRRQRLRDALGAFDAATIATTHQFCHLVLRSLGVAGDTDSNATLVEDLDDLLAEVVDDLYLRAFGDLDGDPPFSHREALRLARAAVGDPQARLEPRDAGPDDVPGQRVAFARQVREELDRRKRRLGVLSYDDLLSQLADALADEDAPARQRMRRRWSVVLVDEFQDTDPVQWQVLDRAFTGHATMVLIGDPKQAIYAFRGGDVTTYLQAAATATTRRRWAPTGAATPPCVDSLQVLLRGAALGDERDRGPRRAGAPPGRAADRGRGAVPAAGGPQGDPRQTAGREPERRRRSGRTCTTTWRATSSGCSPRARTVRGRAAGAAGRRGARLPEQRPAGGAAGARRDRRTSGRRRQRQRLRHPGRDRVAAAARGAGAAAPLRAGAQRRADGVLRAHRRRARRRRRRADRPGRRDDRGTGRSCSPRAAWPRCSRPR